MVLNIFLNVGIDRRSEVDPSCPLPIVYMKSRKMLNSSVDFSGERGLSPFVKIQVHLERVRPKSLKVLFIDVAFRSFHAHQIPQKAMLHLLFLVLFRVADYCLR